MEIHLGRVLEMLRTYLSRAPTSSNVKELGSDELTEAGTPLVLMDAWLFTFSGGKSIAVILFSVLTETHPKVHQTGRVCQCLQDLLLQSGTQWFELHSPDRQFRIASPALDWLRTGWAGSGTGFLALDL